MHLTFANPSLLLGALAAVVPILIHFLSRRRVVRVAFSDLRFLEAVQAKQARSLDLRRLLLLLLRVLAILCVVLAVARPRISGLAAVPDGARSVLFVIDASASMQTQHKEGTRFAEAIRSCAEMAGSLPDGSEIQVLLAGAAPEPLFASWLPASGPVAEALAAATPTDGPCDLPAALLAAADWLVTAHTSPLEVVLLSDLQQATSGRPQLEEAVRRLTAAGPVQLLVSQVGEEVVNGGVRAVRSLLRAVRPGESLSLRAEVRLETREQVFLLELDGRRVAEAVATGTPGSIGVVEFAVTAPAAGRHRGQVSKASDRLPVDDVRPFVLDVRQRISVLLVHGADRGAAGRGGWRYLAEALAPSGGEGRDLFEVRSLSSERLVGGDLAAADVVCFVDPDPLGRQLLGSLLSWLAEGGTAVFFLGDPTLQSYLEQTLLPALGLPGRLEYRARAVEGRENVTLLAREHPVFRGLGEEALATLADVGWQRYFALEEGSARVLLAFTGESPALLEGRYGQGAFLLLPFHLQLAASNLPVSPMFLPLVQRLVAYLAERSGGEETVVVGQRPQVRLHGSKAEPAALADLATLVVQGPEVGEVAAAELTWQRDTPVLRGPATRRRGFYTFVAGTDTVGLVAAAPPAGEGDPRLDTSVALRDLLAEAGLVQSADLGGVAASDFGRAVRGRDMSGWLFAAAVLLLCLELFVGRGVARSPVPA
jgi:hypothetical protein